MKKHTVIFLSIVTIIMSFSMLFVSSCKKTNNGGGSSSDSGVFYFHLHTQIMDSTIGGNTDASDSNTTGSTSANTWFLDSLGRRIELFVPQFFISNIMLVNANGTMLTLSKPVLLKGLDSEDYYVCKVPIGTYTSAMFTVGLANADSNMSPSMMNFITDLNPYPVASSMWSGTDYYGMKITGAYDTSGTGVNPLPFSFNIPNSLTIAHQIMLPTRGNSTYPAYTLLSGGTQYIHVLCDYGRLLGAINLRTSNTTSGTNGILIADSLANNLSNMFRYEE